MQQLKIETGCDQGKTLFLNDGEYVVGRSGACSWQLSSTDNHVSRKHCLIRVANGCATLSNLSSYGTFIVGSGDAVKGQVVLTDGFSFRLGYSETQIVVRELPDEPESTVKFEPQSGFLAAEEILCRPDGELLDGGLITRDNPSVTEAFCKKEIGSDRRARTLLVAGLALALIIGAILIWVLL